jgi:2-keto-3-deoxy-L-rhamnonate aldolase RhmA
LISDQHYYEVSDQLKSSNQCCGDLIYDLQLNNAIGHENASPIIRVPWGEEWMIKRALDSGAHGIMTPMCHSEVRMSRATN